jgi:hypothetical protein
VHTRILTLSAAAAIFAAPLLINAQAPAAGGAQAPPGVQVGVPDGRQGGQGRQGGGGGGRGRGPAAPQPPAPRLPDGRVALNNAPTDKGGLWVAANFGITTPLAPLSTDPTAKPNTRDLNQVPFQPWAKALFDDRNRHELEPHTRCKASGVARQFLTPYGVEFIELPEIQRIYIFDVGGPHTYRTIYMDGRTHPTGALPLYYGHSIGWWEGDTLVVDTRGYNESFWLDRRGVPHTEKLHTIEKFTRTNMGTMRYEVTIDDPGAYTKPWTAGFDLRREAGQELFEYICQQANYGHELMVGEGTKVDRSTVIVP